MSEQPFLAIPLRDGTQASVSNDALRVGDREFALNDIQDARQVAPDPETVALRVANERFGVELQPAQLGDGALLLEALFRLRPALRPAGFESPVTLPPGFPSRPSDTAMPPAANPWSPRPTVQEQPGVYPPPLGTYPSPSQTGYALPKVAGGRLSPRPRSISELIGATFELFFAHWRRWLLLGLLALIVPEIASGIVDAVFAVLGGSNLWAGLAPASSTAASGTFGLGGSSLPAGRDLLLFALNLAATAIIGVLIGGWSAAVLGNAARNALYGHAPQVRDDVRAGFRRAIPAIGANVLVGLIILLILAPLIVLYSVLLTQFGAAIADQTTLDPSSQAASVFGVLGCLTLLFFLPCGVGSIYVFIRLLLAPYIAATEHVGPRAAVRKSWELTRGSWGHTFTPLMAVWLCTLGISFAVGLLQYASLGVATLVIIPVVAAVIAPLGALACVEVLYDLRLRREGYASLVSESPADDAPVSSPV